MERSGETAEHGHVEIEGIARKGLVGINGNEPPGIESGFDTMGSVEFGPRDIGFGDLRELVDHNGSVLAHIDISCNKVIGDIADAGSITWRSGLS
jgi:hypothetical protein